MNATSLMDATSLLDAIPRFLMALPVPAMILFKMTILLALGWLLHFALMRANPRWRVLLWRLMMVGLVLLIPAQLLLPEIPLLVVNAPPKQAAPPHPVLAISNTLPATAYEPSAQTARMELLRQLDEVLPYDTSISARTDIPLDQIPNTTTDELCYHFVTKGYTSVLGLYDNPDIGVYRAIRASRTLSALTERSDLVDGFIKAYGRFELDPDKNHELDRGTLSIALMSADQILMYPLIFEKTKSHERGLLEVICKRYRKMKNINKRYKAIYNEDDMIYSASLNTTKQLALKLLQGFNSQLYESLKVDQEDELFRNIENAIR